MMPASATPTMLTPPRGAIFDMDGLLVDTEPVHAAAYVATFPEFGLSLDLEEYRQRITLAGGTIRDLYREKGGDPQQWEQVFRRKCERFQHHVTHEVALLPGVESLLDLLAQRGTPCVLATGAGRFNAEVVLSHFGLHRHFTSLLAGEDVRQAKPHPEVFFKAAESLQLRPTECISFEDSPKGVRAASDAGVPCVAVPTAWTREGDFSRAALIVDSLAELTLARLEALYESIET